MRFLKSKKLLKRVAVLVILFCVFGYIGLTYILPYAILQPKRTVTIIDPVTISSNFETIAIPIDGIGELRGYFFKPMGLEPKAIVILVHGIGGAKEHFFLLASKLKEEGIASIALDNRAHGESDGDFVTYGFFEKYDIQKTVTLFKKEYPDIPIGIWGASMGGAIALQVMEIDNRIEFGIVESTFTNLPQIVYDYQKRFSGGIGMRYVTDYSLKRAGAIAGFNPEMVNPLTSVKNINQPLFMAHGANDKRIKYEYGQELFKNLASEDKHFELVEGAGHLDVGKIGGEKYYCKVIGFIEKQLN